MYHELATTAIKDWKSRKSIKNNENIFKTWLQKV